MFAFKRLDENTHILVFSSSKKYQNTNYSANKSSNLMTRTLKHLKINIYIYIYCISRRVARARLLCTTTQSSIVYSNDIDIETKVFKMHILGKSNTI